MPRYYLILLLSFLVGGASAGAQAPQSEKAKIYIFGETHYHPNAVQARATMHQVAESGDIFLLTEGGNIGKRNHGFLEPYTVAPDMYSSLALAYLTSRKDITQSELNYFIIPLSKLLPRSDLRWAHRGKLLVLKEYSSDSIEQELQKLPMKQLAELAIDFFWHLYSVEIAKPASSSPFTNTFPFQSFAQLSEKFANKPYQVDSDVLDALGSLEKWRERLMADTIMKTVELHPRLPIAVITGSDHVQPLVERLSIAGIYPEIVDLNQGPMDFARFEFVRSGNGPFRCRDIFSRNF